MTSLWGYIAEPCPSYKKGTSSAFDIENSTEYSLDITRYGPHAVEIIEDIFDDAISLLERYETTFGKGKVYIYGGVLRDIISNSPIQGDLDVITTGSDALNELFSSNPRWGKHNKKLSYAKYDFKYFDNYKYINFYSKEVDIIGCKDIQNHVLKTDLLCCCLLMSLDGKIYEMVEGALNNCQTKKLNLNPLCTDLNKKKLINRIDKLKGRGWESEINIDEIKDVEPQPLTTLDVPTKKSKTSISYSI